ncbi:hypothetical protein [Sulfurisphaera ohwakuensis]|uniref:Demethoxyubiquinone hydroxylase (CLK1/Coq7/Cat5 family) n=1 Tax=Sulfurisphaera ohwakuensis TaxID=69656 RepID=A0A650CK40_SULOH|nr:hypothetical protein [Sulfurisphaera ohwakuensis]MBB5254713.1 demethoxyubiquinone hydroxylase (CLK1/Coq7/Cat5 family) [Sulfurisphaera ohwakuensis]QGR18083.1 hypothetical protein D1869_13460 [Sulfurisphaera ohwakuensis]
MDKYFLALLGEAGATGLAKGIYIIRKEERFRIAYENELSHWEYFKKFKRSLLEKPVYYTLFVVGILVGIMGMAAIRRVVNKVESQALDFYYKNFDISGEIAKIVEDEKHHFIK